MKKSAQILKKLQTPSGLFRASHANVETGYNKSWLRDCVYESLGLEAINDKDNLVRVYRAILNIFLKHEYKIDWAIKEKPDTRYKYIHARFHPETLEEFYEEWGNKQNDAIGAILFKIGDLEGKGMKIIRDIHDLRILQKLVYYLASIQYWQDCDNGMWEENEEIHCSSVGACVAGLKKISKIVKVPTWIIKKGEITLKKLLPWESETKMTDLALLSLIYPYNIVNKSMTRIILRNVEKHLVKEKGVLRYLGDQYYNNNGPAEWTMGLAWLAKIYKEMGNKEKYEFYMEKTKKAKNAKGEMPELYYANTNIHNENSPLGWAQAMYMVAAA